MHPQGNLPLKQGSATQKLIKKVVFPYQFEEPSASTAAEIKCNRKRKFAAKSCDGFRVLKAAAKIVNNQFHNRHYANSL